MSVEGLVRAAGAAIGLARDSFGADAPGEVALPATAPAVPNGRAPGTGRAVEAFDAESGQLNGHAAALSEQDGSAHAQLADAVAAATSGRARVNSIIGAATADVDALAQATTTPHGQRALVTALTRRLQETQRALQDGHADAATRAAGSHVTAADYHAVAQYSPSGAAAATLPASGTSSIGAMPLTSLGSLGSLMGSLPEVIGAGPAARRMDQNGTAVTGGNAVDTVISRALSQHGTPYSWGGGGKTGPGRGDDGKVGFDCSSLMQYAFAGAGVELPRTTYEQIGLGRQVSPGDIRAGDLIFSNFDGRGPGHVQLAISPSHVVEAPDRNGSVQVSAVPAGRIVVRRILS
jgi:cell wall-associated NlpC family hydrolase